MKLQMSINGKDITAYNLTPLEGCLNTLMSPATYKTIATNENEAIHGIQMLLTPSKRRIAQRNITLPFLLQSTSFVDLQRDTDSIIQMLVYGKGGSGVNELYVPMLQKCYRLVFISIDKYTNFGMSGAATLNIKFTEPNPNNRTL